MTGTDTIEYDVPDDETPAARCPHCDRPFARERLCTIHVGERHPEICTAAEREAYEAAIEEEDDDLFVYHLKVVGALGVLYAVCVLGYMVVLGA